MPIKTQKFFTVSLTTFGTLALLSTLVLANNPLPSPYSDVESDAGHYSRAYDTFLAEVSKKTNALYVSEGSRIKASKPKSKLKSNSFGSVVTFSDDMAKLRDRVAVTNAIVASYQRKIPELLQQKVELDGKITVRTKAAFGHLIDDTVTLIEKEGKGLSELPYRKSDKDLAESATSYQMHVNCSIQGLETVKTMLSNGKDNVVCRKVLAQYYKEAVPQEAQQKTLSRLTSMTTWFTSRFTRMTTYLASWIQ